MYNLWNLLTDAIDRIINLGTYLRALIDLLNGAKQVIPTYSTLVSNYKTNVYKVIDAGNYIRAFYGTDYERLWTFTAIFNKAISDYLADPIFSYAPTTYLNLIYPISTTPSFRAKLVNTFLPALETSVRDNNNIQAQNSAIMILNGIAETIYPDNELYAIADLNYTFISVTAANISVTYLATIYVIAQLVYSTLQLAAVALLTPFALAEQLLNLINLGFLADFAVTPVNQLIMLLFSIVEWIFGVLYGGNNMHYLDIYKISSVNGWLSQTQLEALRRLTITYPTN
jgi:hypothetical protein